MLVVAAFEFCHPVHIVILMEADDLSVHAALSGIQKVPPEPAQAGLDTFSGGGTEDEEGSAGTASALR
jgi:hypothetical protein